MSAASAPTGELTRIARTDPAAIEKPAGPVRRGLRRARRWLSGHPRLERGYRIAVGVIGTLLTLGGLILVPLPGPGWLIVFTGLALLGTEFVWAHRLSGWLKKQLARFWAWWHARRDARRVVRASNTARTPNARASNTPR
ncbi:TIGR02611 family protein [Microbacterium horticulturae]|uniref:TIGR02611 family protein n=1 Tax=Microbacterium horticulturae TaxID=3028316 RepID=A0ABY8BY42_9MICO|nr:TIGR02611 family protein [Microbacterium sp. KACC 23027]WEG09094.1 TIGR02611 family protein [Microbacterium sp. KACC 23027]